MTTYTRRKKPINTWKKKLVGVFMLAAAGLSATAAASVVLNNVMTPAVSGIDSEECDQLRTIVDWKQGNLDRYTSSAHAKVKSCEILNAEDKASKAAHPKLKDSDIHKRQLKECSPEALAKDQSKLASYTNQTKQELAPMQNRFKDLGCRI